MNSPSRTSAIVFDGWDDAALSGAKAIYDDPAALLLVFDFSPLAGAFPPEHT